MLIYKGFYDCRLNFRAGIKVTIYILIVVKYEQTAHNKR
jgi:hypothetical protein